MDPSTSAAAKAEIHWVGLGRFHEPWLRYNPQIYAEHIPELNWQSATWDIGVRAIEPKDPRNRRFLITFQFASRRAPHHVLTPGLDFGLFEGPGKCVWRGTVYEVFDAPRDPGYWYFDK
jgi:hypothetical protein